MDVPVSLAQSKNPAAQTGADSRIEDLVSLAAANKDGKGNRGIRKAKSFLDDFEDKKLSLSDASQNSQISLE